MSARLSPVVPQNRFDTLDALRGVALFGVLIADMRGYCAPDAIYGNQARLFPGLPDVIAQSAVDLFITGKGITLFTVLFGIGFGIQVSRAQKRGASLSFIARRLIILLIIGVIHSFFIWSGDILVGLALGGFLLFLFRKSRQQRVLSWSIGLFAATILFILSLYLYLRAGWKLPPSFGVANPRMAVLNAISAYRDGDFWTMTVQRFNDWIQINKFLPFVLVFFALPRFLAGLWAWRRGYVSVPENYANEIRWAATWGLLIGLFADAFVFLMRYGVKPQHEFTFEPFAIAIAEQISYPAIACFYACGLVLLMQWEVWVERFRPFAAVGRMALTNYLIQSLVFTWFFRLTHLFGKVGPAMSLIPSVLFFGLQILFSVWWLNRFHFGPMEWLWRSLTYGEAQPMRREPPEESAALAEA
jgi:uncharacterized protein